MTERFMKVDTTGGEAVAIRRTDVGSYVVVVSDRSESLAALISLGQLRSLLALFPELREAPKEK